MKRSLLLLLFLCLPSSIQAAVGIDTWISVSNGTGTSLSGNLTVSASNSNRVLFWVVIHDLNTAGTTIASPTYGGQAPTETLTTVSGGGANGVRIVFYKLVNPPTGSNAFGGTLSNSDNWHINAASLYDVNQSTPNDTPNGTAVGSAGPATIDVGSATGDLVIGFVGSSSAGTTFTLGADQTERIATGNDGNLGYMSSSEPGATSVTHNYTISASDDWGIVAVSVNPASTSSILPVLSFQSRQRRQ